MPRIWGMVVRSVMRPCVIAMRWTAAISCSLLLHLAGVALLSHMMPGNIGTGSGGGHTTNTFLVDLKQQAGKAQLGAMSAGPAHSQAPAVPASSVGAVATAGGSPQAATYFPISELDVIPEIQRDIDLDAEIPGQRIERGGSIQLALWIDEAGRVVKAEAVKLSGLPPIFGEAAVKAFLQATFRPGMRNGVAVKSRVRLMVIIPASADS